MSITIKQLPVEFQKVIAPIESASSGQRGNNGQIDSLKEIIDCLEALTEQSPKLAKEFARSISIDISKFPANTPELKKIKQILASVDHLNTDNGQIDTLEEIKAIRQQLSLTENYLLSAKITWRGESTTKPDVVKFAEVKPPLSSGGGRYEQPNQKLATFMLGSQGVKPNMTIRQGVKGLEAIAAYHIYDDKPSHILNAGATTSEGQVLFFNYMTLNAILHKDQRGMNGAYNYIKYFMNPGDGKESDNMPDSKFKVLDYAPEGLNQWMVQVGPTKNGAAIFGVNNGYEIYDPSVSGVKYRSSIALNPLTKRPDLSKYLEKDNNTFKFSSACDADTWEINAYYWATRYGLRNFNKDLQQKIPSFTETKTMDDVTLKVGPYHGAIEFGRYWGGNLIKRWGWKADGTEAYTGYQDPAGIAIISGLQHSQQAKNIVDFLGAAQEEYTKQYQVSGPFMPVYIDKDTKAAQEHGYTGFGWKGSDPNTHWMGFQYRTFAHLANYYYLTGDKKAKTILEKFVGFIEKSMKTGTLLPATLNSYLSDGEGRLHNHGPQGSIETSAYSPHNYGLYAQGLVLMAARDKNPIYQKNAQTILDFLVRKQTPKGSFPEPEDGVTYGFHQSEVGIAFCLYQLLLGK